MCAHLVSSPPLYPTVASTASSRSSVCPYPPREPQGLFGRAGWEDKDWPLDLGSVIPFPVSVQPGKERLNVQGLGVGLVSF